MNIKTSASVPLPNGALGKLATDDRQINMIGTMIGKNAIVAEGSLL